MGYWVVNSALGVGDPGSISGLLGSELGFGSG